MAQDNSCHQFGLWREFDHTGDGEKGGGVPRQRQGPPPDTVTSVKVSFFPDPHEQEA